MSYLFDHEKLKAYQESIKFVAWVTPILERFPKTQSVRGHLNQASTSAPLNIAEGNAKFSMEDRSRYLEIASGSALECAAALDVLVAQKHLTVNEIHEGKLILQREVDLVMGLRNNAQSRISEEATFYGIELVDDD